MGHFTNLPTCSLRIATSPVNWHWHQFLTDIFYTIVKTTILYRDAVYKPDVSAVAFIRKLWAYTLNSKYTAEPNSTEQNQFGLFSSLLRCTPSYIFTFSLYIHISLYLYSPTRSSNKTKQQRKHKYRYNSSKQYVIASSVFNTIKQQILRHRWPNDG